MRGITKAVISFFELIEAEGRSLRTNAVTVIENMMVIFVALFLMFMGCVVAFLSICLWLREYIGWVGATAVVALLLLILGGILFSVAHAGARKGRHFMAKEKTASADRDSLPGGQANG